MFIRTNINPVAINKIMVSTVKKPDQENTNPLNAEYNKPGKISKEK